ncbi:MAG: hypothetical protein Kow0068_13020 [Marinilabiliales bacterium]
MNKYLILIVLFAIFFASCNNENANNSDELSDSLAVEKDTTKLVAIEDFDNYAKEHVGELIKLEGVVQHVCSHGFMRMYLTDKRNEYTVEVKANEDMKFDTLWQDKMMTVKGVINELVIDSAYLADWEAELLAEADSSKNEEAVTEENEKHEDDTHHSSPLEQIESYRLQIAKRGEPLRFYSVIAETVEETENK